MRPSTNHFGHQQTQVRRQPMVGLESWNGATHAKTFKEENNNWKDVQFYPSI